MRKMKNFKVLLVVLLSGLAAYSFGQESIYGITSVKEIPTTDSEKLDRPGSCWSNAGTALLEAEWIRTGKEKTDLSELDFVRNAYLLKSEIFLETDGEIRVDEKGIAYDVITLMEKYGMAPEEAFMKSPQNESNPKSGEMDAIIRGTLRTVQLKEEGQLTERWKNILNGALTRHLGDVKLEFTYRDVEYTPKSFAQKSGLEPSDYVMITSDTRNPLNESFVLEVKNNWNKSGFYNTGLMQMVDALDNAIAEGYAVLWYGNTGADYIFKEESVAIVPAVKMPETDESAEKLTEPVPEASVSPDSRQTQFETLLDQKHDYMLIYGKSEDKNGKGYYMAKYVCEGGNKGLHLSDEFVKLNTVYLMLNKNALSGDMRSELGL